MNNLNNFCQYNQIQKLQQLLNQLSNYVYKVNTVLTQMNNIINQINNPLFGQIKE